MKRKVGGMIQKQYGATNTMRPTWRNRYGAANTWRIIWLATVYHPARDNEYHIVRLEEGCQDPPNDSYISETLVYAKVSKCSYRTMDFGTS